MHPRVREPPGEGLRPDRHREGLQPLRLWQRRLPGRVHADLLAADLDEDTALRYIDRFLMHYYPHGRPVDPPPGLPSGSEEPRGGIDYPRDVIVEDRLGIAEELANGRCRRLWIPTSVNGRLSSQDLEKRSVLPAVPPTPTSPCPASRFVASRGQQRPVDWPSDFVPLDQLGGRQPIEPVAESDESGLRWSSRGSVNDFLVDGGRAIKRGAAEVAVYRFDSQGSWYALPEYLPTQTRGGSLTRHPR